MITVNRFSEILKMAGEGPLYVRWSCGPDLDKRLGRSVDQITGHAHSGLSCQQVHADRPNLAAQMLVEYRFLRRKNPDIFCWVFRADINGTDSDGAPTADAATIHPVARIGDDLLERLTSFSEDWWAHHNSSPKTWAEGQKWPYMYPDLDDYIN